MSLRNFIREVLDLEAIPADLPIPRQGPARTGGAQARGGRGDKPGKAGGGSGGGGGGGPGIGSTGDAEGFSDHSPNA